MLEFASDDPEVIPTLAALYHAAPETDAPPTLQYTIRRAGPDRFTATSPSAPVFGPAPLAHCWAFTEWRAIEDVLNHPGPDQVYVHAAGVRMGHRLLLLVGPSGSGKSTLTAVLLQRGYAALGDDVLRFAPAAGVFMSVPRSIKIDTKDLPIIGLRQSEIPNSLLGTFLAHNVAYVSPRTLNPSWEAPAGRPWGLVILDAAERRGSATVVRFSEGEAAIRLAQSQLGARHGMGPEAATAATLKLVESVGESVAFRAGGDGVVALADRIEEAARA